MTKILTAIFSYNSKDMTKRVYDELNHEGHDLIIIDNSSSDEHIPDFGKVYHLGYENIEFGAMIQWLMANEELVAGYDFVGFLNNDTYGYDESHIRSLHEHLDDSVGISHWSLYPTDPHAGQSAFIEGAEPFRRVDFIENICPYFNIKLVREFRNYFPLHKYGCIDIVISRKSLNMGLSNIVINSTPFHHIRSGVRVATGSFDGYRAGYASATAEWNGVLATNGVS